MHLSVKTGGWGGRNWESLYFVESSTSNGDGCRNCSSCCCEERLPWEGGSRRSRGETQWPTTSSRGGCHQRCSFHSCSTTGTGSFSFSFFPWFFLFFAPTDSIFFPFLFFRQMCLSAVKAKTPQMKKPRTYSAESRTWFLFLERLGRIGVWSHLTWKTIVFFFFFLKEFGCGVPCEKNMLHTSCDLGKLLMNLASFHTEHYSCCQTSLACLALR